MVLEEGNLIATEGEEISLKFNLWVRNENVFGTVFRIITDKEKNIDLMYSVGENNKRFPILVTGDAVHPIQKEAHRESWIAVGISFNPNSGDVSLKYESTRIEVNYPELKGTSGVRISFGFCPFTDFSLVDVASVNLKDVILKRGGREIRHWKMARHNKDVCYDEMEQVPAVGNNTSWLIDQYITWKHLYTQNFPSSPSIAFDSRIAAFYMATDKKKLFIFHPDERRTDTIHVKGGEYAANYPNQLIFLPGQNRLLSYSLDENLYSFFDPVAQAWSSDTPSVMEHDYWNNSIVYRPADSTLISFSGYGHYHYNNELLISHPWKKDFSQRRLTLDEIHPRYSSASAIVGNILYLFGGRGCPSGRQELSPRNYYDLYAVDLSTFQVNKLWEAPDVPEEGDFQPGENMVYDKEKDCFYFFCGQRGGTLMKMDVHSPVFEAMSLPIGMNMESQYVYTNLYYSPAQKKLYAAIHQADVSGKSRLDIYAINYPPISVRELAQSTAIPTSKATGRVILILVITGMLAAVGALWYLNRKKKVSSVTDETGSRIQKEEAGADGHPEILSRLDEADRTINLEKEFEEVKEAPVSAVITESCHFDFSRKCICLFDGFRVIDREGQDVTSLFTPILKSLLVLLILYTGKDAKGIIGHKLLQTLWYDKTEESAKNNRNVYMSKLRSLLERVGDIKILNQNGFWSIQFEEGTLCDYLEALKLFRENKSEELDKLLELLLRGVMLPNMEIDWIDKFKNEFSDTTIDLLCRLLKRKDLSDMLKLKIADTLFQHDCISEEALCTKCSILSRHGKNGLAKTVYDTFCKEYYTSLGTEYKSSLIEVIEKVNRNDMG